MQIAAESLEKLASGETNRFTLERPHLRHPLGDDDVTALAAAITANPNIESIDLHSSGLGNDHLRQIAQSLQGKPQLTSLHLSHNQIGDDCARDFAEVIRTAPKLREFITHGNNAITAEGLSSLASAIGENGNLRNLSFYATPLDRDGAAAVTQMVASSPRLENLNIISCGLMEHPEHTKPVIDALVGSRNLVKLEVEDVGDLWNRLSSETNPNLHSTVWQQRMKKHTIYKANEVSALERFTPFKDEAKPIEALYTRDLAAIYPVLPILSSLTRSQDPLVNPANLHAARDFLEHPPELDTADLFKTNAKGFTALDHPATWQRFGEFADALLGEGIHSKNSRGETWLECGLASAADVVIPELNKRGVRVSTQDLLTRDDNGILQPSPLLKAAIAGGKPEHLFTEENFHGSSGSGISAVHAALPEASQSRITHLFSLKQQVQAASPSRQGIGR